MTTILMLVSRNDYLQLIFAGLEMLACDSNTNLLVIVDGDPELFLKTRNFVENSKFNERLCVQYKSNDKMKNFDIAHRRNRIAKLHNYAKQFIRACEYVFVIEDDTTFDALALEKLLQTYYMYPHAGFVQGVQVGRHGIKHYGIWQVDNVYEPTEIISSEKHAGVTECDAGGLYCTLTKAENYMAHEFKPFNNNDLGPDVDYGIALRQQGYMNYTNWSVPCNHHTKDGIINPLITPQQVAFVKEGQRYRQRTIV